MLLFVCVLGNGGSGGGGKVEEIHPLLREIQDTQGEPTGTLYCCLCPVLYCVVDFSSCSPGWRAILSE